jgi:hypothetical protein
MRIVPIREDPSMTHHFRRAFLAVPFLLAGLGAPAGADSISYSFQADFGSQTGQVPLFNPSYGTLDEVDMSFSGSVGGGIGHSSTAPTLSLRTATRG